MRAEPSAPSARRSGCPAIQALEAYTAGEEPVGVRHHLDSCDECTSTIQGLREARAAFLQRRPTRLFLDGLALREATRPKRWGLGWKTTAPLLFAAAAATLVFVMRPSDDALRYKGAALQVIYKRGDLPPSVVGPQTVLRPGDSLRFVVRSARPGHVLVLDRDGTGSVAVFHPFGSQSSGPVPQEAGGLLPGSITLDSAPGPEWLVLLLSPHPLEVAPLAAKLRALSGDELENLRPPCDGCSVDIVRLQKEP